jgi:hypothetical protein
VKELRGLDVPSNVDGRSSIWAFDLPEIPELDNLFAPEV